MCLAQDPVGAAFGVWQTAGVFGYRYAPIEGAPPDYTSIHFDAAGDGEPIDMIISAGAAPSSCLPSPAAPSASGAVVLPIHIASGQPAAPSNDH